MEISVAGQAFYLAAALVLGALVGVLYDLSTPIYICYGIPGMRNVAPPREIADVCVWLPLSSDAPEGSGFWIIYQSAENGKCVR